MKIFNDKTRKVISTLAIVIVLMRLVEFEENQLARFLEILTMLYRIVKTVDSLVSKNGSIDKDIDLEN